MERKGAAGNRDAELARRLRLGDAAAVSDLDSAYRRRIHRLAMAYVHDDWDAEEVTQDVLLRVLRKIDAFRGEAALSSWIQSITRNAALSRLRGGRIRRAPAAVGVDGVAAGAPETPARSPSPEDRVYRAEVRRRLAGLLARMPPVYRAPIVLRDIRGLSTGEASALLHLRPETLKSRLHRGRLALRSALRRARISPQAAPSVDSRAASATDGSRDFQ